MLTVALPDALEVRANATFEALMWALARPGEVREMQGPGLSPVLEALIDIECTAYGDSDELRRLIAETGATAGGIASADHVFVERPSDNLEDLALLRCGSSLYPDEGSTVAIGATIGAGERLRLTGPGIDGVRDVQLALPPAFWRLRSALCSYPEGFDLFIVDGREVVGLPRSTKVEVL